MLEINPFFRKSARELIKNPYFDEIRMKDNEDYAPEKIKLDIDADGSFNYEENKSTKFN